ncbi:MAG: pyridoxamine 5'-phosphate oxidase [Alphaproteobacteria bacterium]|nr:pyridoxamine 5'-phosphate oxidase [Alphaproteobacteria bacterium]
MTEIIPFLSNPWVLFGTWYAQAERTEVNDANAMVLATVGQGGMPSARTVLMKDYDERGLVFYTNKDSRKGVQLLIHQKAALLFYWKSLRRQVRFEGAVEDVSDEEADAYFASRPRGSQLGAWASRQSQPLPSRHHLENSWQEFEKKFDGQNVPRPFYWGGYRVKPAMIEFWHDQPSRLHDRLVYERVGESWHTQRLYP